MVLANTVNEKQTNGNPMLKTFEYVLWDQYNFTEEYIGVSTHMSTWTLFLETITYE